MDNRHEMLPYWLALHRIRGLRYAHLQKLRDAHGIQQIFEQPALASLLPPLVRDQVQNFSWEAVEADLNWQQSSPLHHILCLEDDHYPALLKQITDPPLVLYVHGAADILNAEQLAIVGSRNPSTIGYDNALQFARALAANGLVITSGLAQGIDAAAHWGAVQEKKPTIAVLGTGIDVIYPAKNASLAQAVIDQGGALVSEFWPGTAAHHSHFPQRNRIISGMSRALLVVEATLRSGSLISARLANEQGRDVLAIPGSIHNPLARGCHGLIKEGAKLVESVADILEELQRPQAAALSMVKKSTKRLSKELSQLLSAVDEGVTSIETLIRRSGLTSSAISVMLMTLELEGHIESVQGGYVLRTKRTQPVE